MIHMTNHKKRMLVIYSKEAKHKELSEIISGAQIESKDAPLRHFYLLFGGDQKQGKIYYLNKLLEKETFLYFKKWRSNLASGQFARCMAEIAQKNKIEFIDKEVILNGGNGKFFQILKLSQHNIPTPKTLAFIFTQEEISNLVKHVSDNFSFPIILKPNLGNHGKDVILVNTLSELKEILIGSTLVQKKTYLIQEFINHTEIYRALIFNKEILYIQKRFVDKVSLTVNNSSLENTDLNDNLPEDVKSTCIKCAEVLSRDLCGIDIILTKNNFYILEVNPSPGIIYDLQNNREFKAKFINSLVNYTANNE